MRENARLPGRSRGTGEINEDGDGGKLGGVHDRIIIHAREYVNPRAPLDTRGDRALGCLNCLHTRQAHRSRNIDTPMLFGLALVIVLLSLLLTVLIGERGLRGVPTRA